MWLPFREQYFRKVTSPSHSGWASMSVPVGDVEVASPKGSNTPGGGATPRSIALSGWASMSDPHWGRGGRLPEGEQHASRGCNPRSIALSLRDCSLKGSDNALRRSTCPRDAVSVGHVRCSEEPSTACSRTRLPAVRAGCVVSGPVFAASGSAPGDRGRRYRRGSG